MSYCHKLCYSISVWLGQVVYVEAAVGICSYNNCVTMLLLQTKLHIPYATQSELIQRNRLLERLHQGMARGAKLTFVSAPAGFGKTTLITSWLTQLQHSVGWIGLDSFDNELHRFLTYLLAACQQISPKVGETAVAFLRTTPVEQHPNQLNHILTLLINDFTHLNQPAILVLDDYHHLHQPLIHQAMTFLLDHLPPRLHLVIITRADPPLPLTTLRVKRQMNEVRAVDLQFTKAETNSFLDLSGVKLTASLVEDLCQRTEGWVAGLQLATIALQSTITNQNAADFIHDFSGNRRHIIEYLATEVLHKQSDEVKRFLLYTAVLTRFCPPLCDAVTGMENGRLMLDHLWQANLFLIPLDNKHHWFRYHHLFADFLHHHLQQEEPHMLKQLHRRAADWFNNEGWIDEAIHHAIAAQAFDIAADLIESQAQSRIQQGDLVELIRWIEQLPAEHLSQRIQLRLDYAWALSLAHRTDEAMPLVQALEGHLNNEWMRQTLTINANHLQGNLSTLQSVIAVQNHHTTEAIAHAEQALKQLPSKAHYLRSLAFNALAFAQELRGDYSQARQFYLDAAQENDLPLPNNRLLYFVWYGVGKMCLFQGDLEQAKQLFHQAINVFTGYSPRTIRILADLAYTGLIRFHLERHELAEAEALLSESVAFDFDAERIGYFQDYLAMARIMLSQGHVAQIPELFNHPRQLSVDQPYVQAIILAWDARIALHQGALDVAQRHINKARSRLVAVISQDGSRPEPLGFIELTQAQLLLRQGHEGCQRALLLLQEIAKTAEVRQHNLLVMESLVYQVDAYFQLKKSDKAQQALQKLLQLAEPGGYFQLFVEGGTAVSTTLTQLLPSLTPSPFLQKLQAILGIGTSKPTNISNSPLDSLTKRELATLELMAKGHTTNEIAQQLTISVSTVRTYYKRVYSKLGVHNRVQAIFIFHKIAKG